MTVLTKFDPFRDVNQFQNTLNRLFTNWEPRFVAPRFETNDELMTSGNFVPAVDIYEDEHALRLKFEVPGIDQKDLDIRLENNTLTVRGERKLEKEEKQENFHRIERSYGSFVRSFTLPNTVEVEKVKADYENGVLNLTLPKKAEAKPKQIKVTVGGSPKEVKGETKAA